MSPILQNQVLRWGSEEVQMLRSVKDHPRYGLRMVAIGSVAVGVFLNIFSFGLCHQLILHGLAFIPLCISMFWNHVDLVSIRLFKKFLPVGSLVFVESLGFLAFLALLIANGIIVNNLHYMWGSPSGNAMLMTYTSVPWMVCCGIHGYIALQNIWQLIVAVPKTRMVCPQCRGDWKVDQKEPGKATDRADYSLLTHKNNGDYDVESDASAKSIDTKASDEADHMLISAKATI